MRLIKIANISIDPGSPSPRVLSSDYTLKLFFYYNKDKSLTIGDTQMRDTIRDQGVAIIEFKQYLNYKFGLPGNEILSGHPYYKLGLQPYNGFIIDQSSWIDELIKLNSVHPYHNAKQFDNYKHYIFSFHDSTFECIAKDYRVEYVEISLFDAMQSSLEKMTINEM